MSAVLGLLLAFISHQHVVCKTVVYRGQCTVVSTYFCDFRFTHHDYDCRGGHFESTDGDEGFETLVEHGWHWSRVKEGKPWDR